jgi:hypothetical protein
MGQEMQMLLMGANLYEAYGRVGKGEAPPGMPAQQAMKAGAAIPTELGKITMEQPFLKGTRDVVNAIQEPGRYGSRLAAATAGRFIPTIASDVAAETDQNRRVASGGTFTENIRAGLAGRIPGARETLPVRRDVFGQPVAERTGSIYNFMFPQGGSRDPIAQELVRVNASINEPHRQPGEDAQVFDLRSQLVGKYMQQQIARLLGSARYRDAEDDTLRRKMIETQARTADEIASRKLASKTFKTADAATKAATIQDLLQR